MRKKKKRQQQRRQKAIKQKQYKPSFCNKCGKEATVFVVGVCKECWSKA